MSKASLRQAGAVLRLIDEAEWDAARVQTFVANWGGIRDLTVALHEGRLTPEQLKAVVEGRFEIAPPAPETFESGEVASEYGYPEGYAIKPIAAQVDILMQAFGLSLGYTSQFMGTVLPTLTLPEGAEGWFAIPSVSAVAKRFFPEVQNPAEQYCRAVTLMLEKISATRKLYNYREGQITSDRLRQCSRTVEMLTRLAESQHGDILIVPAQFGFRHRGRSVRKARALFTEKEFGLGAFAVGAMLITHPERLVQWEQLHVDCAGDEFDSDADGSCSRAPLWFWHGVGVGFGTGWVDGPYARYGTASCFLPQ